MQRISHWVNNKVVAGTSGNVGKVYNPATGEVQAEVDLASVAEVDAVVANAKEAFVTWRASNLSRRAEIMFRMRELIDANRKELASIVSLEHGKVPSDAMGEIARGLENIEFACGIPAMLKGGYSEQASGGVDVYQFVSHLVLLQVLRRSTSQPWCQCGCLLTQSCAETPSS